MSTTRGSGSNTGGGAGTGSGNGSGAGAGTHPTGGAGTGPKLVQAAAAMHTVARQHPAGRAALALIWLGLLIGTAGLWQLHVELRRHPLPGGAA